MKLPLLCTLFLSALTTTSALANPLPSLDEKGWASYYAGFQGSGFELGVDTSGQVILYFAPRKNQRINTSWPVEAQIRVERRDKDGEKWVQKKTSLDGFTTGDKVEFGQEKVEFVATVTGDVKFKVMIEFDKYGVNIQSEFANTPKDADEADYRLVLECKMPDLMPTSSKYDEKELKGKTRGDEVRVEFKKEKDERIPLYVVQDPEKLTANLPTSIMLKADKIGRKKLTWSMLDSKDTGAFELEFKSSSNRFLDGFDLRSILIDEKGQRLSKGIRMEYK
ncbi:MAG: hypothetical protein ACSHX6_15035 [Akkermansiaceae bacterium]